jgi:methyltransferase
MARLNGRGYLVLVGALATQRLVEMRWSARNVRRSGPGRRASTATFPMMVGVNVALFVVPVVTRYRRPAPPRSLQAVALTGLAAATGLRLWVIHTLGESWNVRAHVPEAMIPVTTGPYRWVRHPNYVAVAVEFACVPLLAGGYVEAAALSAANALVLLPRIREEESLLDAVPGYRDAFAGRPRFVPRLRAVR